MATIKQHALNLFRGGIPKNYTTNFSGIARLFFVISYQAKRPACQE